MSAGPAVRAGLCGIGLDAYWDKFTGLKQRLEGYVAEVAARLERPGAALPLACEKTSASRTRSLRDQSKLSKGD